MPINLSPSVRRLLRSSGGGGSEKLESLRNGETYDDNYPGSDKEPFLDLTENTYINEAIDDINEVLGMLIPAEPPRFPNSQQISFSNNKHYLCQGAPINDASITAQPGDVIVTQDDPSNDRLVSNNAISGVGPGDTGTMAIFINGVEQTRKDFSSAFETGVQTGASGSFNISDNSSYENFWQTFDVSEVTITNMLQGVNSILLKHSGSGIVEESVSAEVVFDDLSAPQPTVAINDVTATGTTVIYSGIPQARSGTSVEITFEGTDTTGITYVQNVCVASGDRLNQTTYQYSGPNSLNTTVPVTSSDLGIKTVTQTVQNDPGMVVPKITLYNSRGSRQESATVTLPSMGNIDNSSVKQGHIIADRIPIYENKSSLPRFEASASYDPSEQYPTASSPGNFVTLPMTESLAVDPYKSLAVNYAGQVKFASGSQADYSSDLLGGIDYSQKSSTQYFSVSYTGDKYSNVSLDFSGQVTDLYVGVYHGDSNKHYWVTSDNFSPAPGYEFTGFNAELTPTGFPKGVDHDGGEYLQFSFANAQSHGGMSFETGNQTVTFLFVMNSGDHLDYLKIYETLGE